jgi:hypothetical protein
MASEFCPRCGAARIGALKFCRSCGFDFDAQDVAQPPDPRSYSERYAGTPYSSTPTAGTGAITPARPRVMDERLRGLLILVGIVVILLVVLNLGGVLKPSTGTGGGGPSAANLPPAGTIWFGSSFDPQTFAISSRLTTQAEDTGEGQ